MFGLSYENPDTLIELFDMGHDVNYGTGPNLMEKLGLAGRTIKPVKLILTDVDAFCDGRLQALITWVNPMCCF
ncbi:Ff.00g065270.m01.CDS01 [Fusarium sp. VM40]|nr:Ff.00g065270.m01.CDS01 [Fusarium sp. VM40]